MTARRVVFQGFDENPSLTEEAIALPDLKPGEILGKIRIATICGSDLHTIAGKRQEPSPSVLGHEGVIEVVCHTRDESDLQIGDRLTFHVADCCSECEHCLDGLQQKCSSLFKYGHALTSNESGFNGCYASHIVLRSGTHVAKIPHQLSDVVTSPLNCALATMVNAVDGLIDKKRSAHRKRSALIQGAGLLGVYGCALLSNSGFDVYCSDVNVQRLDVVKKFGAIPLAVGNPSDKPKENSLDVVIEVCGVPSVISQGIRLLRPGGSYVFVGMVHPDSHLNLTGEQIIRKCLTIRGVHNYAARHLDEALEFLVRTAGKYPYSDLVSPLYKLSDIQTAVEVAKTQTYFRVCVEP